MEPKVIENSFLAQEELEDIKTKVFMLKDHWKPISDQLEKSSQVVSKILPAGAYSDYFSEKEIANNNKLMFENFGLYYEKIRNRLSKYFNVPIGYSGKLQFPGFHIFLNNGTSQVFKSNINFHLDRFPKLDKLVVFGKIESIIIPITLPSSGGCLLYNSNGERNASNRYKPRIPSDKVFNYTLGMMTTWPGDLLHSIGPFSLMDSSESRITMQMHVNLQSNHGTIFW